jgi:hypothetical protein
MSFLAERSLRPQRLYRCNRYDVTADIPPDAPIDDQLRLCSERVVRINELRGTTDVRSGVFYPIYSRRSALPWWIAPVPFAFDVAWRHTVGFVRRVAALARGAVRRIGRDARAAVRGARSAVPTTEHWPREVVRHPIVTARVGWAALRGALQGIRRSERQRPRTVRRRSGPLLHGFRARLEGLREGWRWERMQLRLNTNASGDFTLLSREDWATLRGYAELEMFSMHIDGLLLYQAYYAGIKERTVPYRIYHLEHGSGFKPEPKDVEALNTRLERSAVPQVTMEQFKAWAADMYRTKQPILFNDSDWGLARDELPETGPEAQRVLVGAAHG